MTQWQDRRLLRLGEISSSLIEKANGLSKKERFLFDIIEADALNEAIFESLADNIVSSYQIEREYLDSDAVKSFIISSMGLKVSDWMETDWTVSEDGDDFVPREQRAVQAIMACLNDSPLTHDMIFKVNGLACGDTKTSYRNHHEVVRNAVKVIYRAPEPQHIPRLMDEFLYWWNGERTLMPPTIGSAIAHYGFVAIHPFADGNGRTARALAEKALITSKETIFRPYSLSSAILKKQMDYYAALRTGDPYVFIEYILNVHADAIENGIREARRLHFLKGFFRRAEFSFAEKSVLRKMSTEPESRWLPDDFYLIPDGRNIFEELQERGVIIDGKLNLGFEPTENTSCSPSPKL